MRIWQLGKVLKNTNEARWPSGEAHLLRDPSEARRRGAKAGIHRPCFDLVLKRQGCEEPPSLKDSQERLETPAAEGSTSATRRDSSVTAAELVETYEELGVDDEHVR